MEYSRFGKTDMQLSIMGLGGLLAHYEGVCGHPSSEEKGKIYLRAAELGINLFDTGYGDEVHIPNELKGTDTNYHFSLKVGAPKPNDLEDLIDKQLKLLCRDSIDILRVHYYAYKGDNQLANRIVDLKQAGKVRSLCMIRHTLADQKAYAKHGPEPDSDADLVIYNYVCRWQETGLEQSDKMGQGVLIMKALGGQWISWLDKTQTDWQKTTPDEIIGLSPRGKGIRSDLGLIYPIVAGPWHELSESGETGVPTSKALSWVLKNKAVSSVLVAVASVDELEETLAAK